MNITVICKGIDHATLINYSGNLQFFPVPSLDKKKLSYEALIFQLFTGEKIDSPPIAALMALADNLPSYKDYWLCAEPVKFEVDLDQVYLLPKEAVKITHKVAHEFAANLNLLLIQDGLKLLIGDNQRWYIHSLAEPKISTHPLADVQGKPIINYLPEGPRENYWKKILTELQMLLAELSLKVKDEENTGVDGVWLWGEGSLNRKYKSHYASAISENIFIKGLADWCEVESKGFAEIDNLLEAKPRKLFIEINSLEQLDHLLKQNSNITSQMIFYTAEGSAFRLKPMPFYRQWIKRIFQREKANRPA